MLSYPRDLFHPPETPSAESCRIPKKSNHEFIFIGEHASANESKGSFLRKLQVPNKHPEGRPACATSLRGRGCKPCQRSKGSLIAKKIRAPGKVPWFSYHYIHGRV